MLRILRDGHPEFYFVQPNEQKPGLHTIYFSIEELLLYAKEAASIEDLRAKLYAFGRRPKSRAAAVGDM